MNDTPDRLSRKGQDSRLSSALWSQSPCTYPCALASWVNYRPHSAEEGTEAPEIPVVWRRSQSKTATGLKLEAATVSTPASVPTTCPAGVSQKITVSPVQRGLGKSGHFYHPLPAVGFVPSTPTLSLPSSFASRASRPLPWKRHGN